MEVVTGLGCFRPCGKPRSSFRGGRAPPSQSSGTCPASSWCWRRLPHLAEHCGHEDHRCSRLPRTDLGYREARSAQRTARRTTHRSRQTSVISGSMSRLARWWHHQVLLQPRKLLLKSSDQVLGVPLWQSRWFESNLRQRPVWQLLPLVDRQQEFIALKENANFGDSTGRR